MARGPETIRQDCCNWWRSSCCWKQKTYKTVCGYVDYCECCSLSYNSRCHVLRKNNNTSTLMQSLRPGRPEDRILVGARFSAPVQIGPGAHPASYTMGTGSSPGGKAAGAWRLPPTPSSAEVKERVEVCLCSPSWPSWPLLG